MKKKIFIILGIILAIVATATTVYAASFTNITFDGVANYDEANKMISLMNQERNKVGAANLQLDYDLTSKAQERAKEIALYFSHTRPDGSDVLASLNLYGENIYAGSASAEDAMSAWMKSDGHRENILRKSFKSVGIAEFQSKNGAAFWVQVFSIGNASNTRTFTGTKELKNVSVRIKSEYLRELNITDFSKKTINAGDTYEIQGLTLASTGSKILSLQILNENAKWTSSDNKIATVSNGVIKGISEGQATITANVNGLTKKYIINVKGQLIEPSKIEISKTSLNLKEGETSNLTATVYPENANDKKVTWKSSNENVAVVDQDGNITAKSEGEAVITATTSNGKKVETKITVESKYKFINDIRLSNAKSSITVGDTFKVSATVTPSDADETVSFKSSNKGVATVDEYGNVKGVGEGSTTITVYSKNTSQSFKLTVNKKQTEQKPTQNNNQTNTNKPSNNQTNNNQTNTNKPSNNQTNNNQTTTTPPKQEETKPKEIPVTGISLNCSEITLKVGETFQMQATVYPANANVGQNVTWSGVYYKIAELMPNNSIVGRSAGEGTVTVYAGTAGNIHTASCKVRVIADKQVESISLNYLTKMKQNEARSLDATVYPQEARTYGQLKYTSSNPSIVSVNENGILFSYNTKGSATITVTAPNGVSASRTITVE